ncbi:MAG: ferritin [Bacteroidia bacterium]|nr:ferritin [Bacteroidia bacterium]
MKMSAELIQNLNEQLNKELYAQYMYLTIASYFIENGYDGFGAFFLKQSEEEGEHAMRLFEYMMERDIPFTPMSIQAPPKDFASPLACFKTSYEYEQEVTRSYHALFKKVRESGEYDAEEFLLWYIKEQREEEALMRHWVEKLSMADENPAALLFLDKEARKAAEKEE